jgi:hypothetical protein
MDPLLAFGTAAASGLGLGGLLFSAMHQPLLKLLRGQCPDDEAITFWARFSAVMLVLTPLFFALTFGVPNRFEMPSTTLSSLLVSAVTSAIVGGFLAMIGMGAWVTFLSRRSQPK